MLKLEALNESQQRAVAHASGENLLIVAGPGSGKTLVITQRIFYLIQKLHVPPEEILVVTFTKDAALSMQNRFIEQSELSFPVNFGTFHSIFYNILRQSQGTYNFNILTERQKKDILLPILREQLKKQFNEHFIEPQLGEPANSESRAEFCDGSDEAAQLLSAFSYYKNTGDEQIAESKVNAELKAVFKECFERYEQVRKTRKLIDFDDMACECRRLLDDNASLRAEWQRRFKHILIDEFQDINPAQMSGVELLKGEQCRLFAVGDDDQSIYGFRGSRPECMQLFLKKYNAKQIILNTNYRSTREIVDASLRVIGENKKRFIKELKAGSGRAGSPVILKGFKENSEEYSYLINELLSYVKPPAGTAADLHACSSETYSDTLAVFFRTNILMQFFAAELSAKGIPFIMKEKTNSIYEHEIMKDIWAYLELSQNQGNRECLLRILNRPVRYINREAVMTKDADIWNGMKNYYLRQRNIPYGTERIKAVERFKEDVEYIRKLPPFLAVKYILKSIGYEKFCNGRSYSAYSLSKDIKREYKEIIEWICEEAKKYESLAEWSDARKYYDDSINKKGGSKAWPESNIYLMTVHASKGLEFDRVWIPDCNENIFPYGRMTDADTCEEERRIFYVAMTRAKKSLELLYLTGTKENPRLPSRFLNPILKSIT